DSSNTLGSRTSTGKNSYSEFWNYILYYQVKGKHPISARTLPIFSAFFYPALQGDGSLREPPPDTIFIPSRGQWFAPPFFSLVRTRTARLRCDFKNAMTNPEP
ncbi:TPA: hypothetical protein ACUNBO_004210, partial [Morganella morganii]